MELGAFVEEEKLLEARLGLFAFQEKEENAVGLEEVGECDSTILEFRRQVQHKYEYDEEEESEESQLKVPANLESEILLNQLTELRRH